MVGVGRWQACLANDLRACELSCTKNEAPPPAAAGCSFPMSVEMSSLAGGRVIRSLAIYVCAWWIVLVSASTWANDTLTLPARVPVEAPPGWTTRVDAAAADPNNSRLEYLLIDRQVRVEDQGTSSYSHFVTHLGNQSAVDDESHVQIDYQPATERIVLHRLSLRRGEQNIDQLQRARISTLRRERDLENGIIDGALTTSIVLEDVRVGDILEYSYTRLTGKDSLGTAFSDSFLTQWSVPVRHSYLRVLHPTSRNITVRSTRSEQPAIRDHGAWRELVWRWDGLSSLPEEDDQPGWFVHYPYIQLSEYPSWQAVVRWAQRLYPKVSLSAELQTLVEQLRTSGATPSEQIIQALRFVQDEIRYTGIEIGPGGYQPQPPAVVLQRRFGDCKEKSYLLVTVLDALGIEARPALVNTYRKQATRDLLPSPAAFNHIIVRVAHDGKVYWLDPTRTLQGGTLQNVGQAHFGAALVIDAQGAFETMPAPVLDAPDEVVVERFDLTAGVFKPAKMTVESTYLGGEADRMRRYFANNSPDEVTHQYLNFYKDTFPSIAVTTPFSVTDDRQANKLVVTESYGLERAFHEGNNDKLIYFEFTAHVVQSAARAPGTIVRTTPLELSHPTHVSYRAEVRLPEPWPIENSEQKIDAAGFAYRSAVRYAHDTLTTDYSFKTLSDDLPAADVPEHARKLEAVREDAYYYLSYEPPAPAKQTPFKLSIATLFAVLGGVIGGALLIRWLHRYDNPRFPKPASAHAPEGIAGWLLLPALGTLVTPFLLAYALFNWRNAFDAGWWATLGSEQDAVLAHWGKIGMFFFLLLGYALLLLSAFLLYLLFKKRRNFPAGYLALLWMAVLWGVISHGSFAALGLKGSGTVGWIRLVLDAISAGIWTAYMMRSERVRATFSRIPNRTAPATASLDPLPQ